MIAATYTIREAESNLDEVLARVRAGERVLLMEEGRQVAEIRPVTGPREEGIRELQEKGIIGPLVKPIGSLEPLAEKPGALARFLESRG